MVAYGVISELWHCFRI